MNVQIIPKETDLYTQVKMSKPNIHIPMNEKSSI